MLTDILLEIILPREIIFAAYDEFHRRGARNEDKQFRSHLKFLDIRYLTRRAIDSARFDLPLSRREIQKCNRRNREGASKNRTRR